MIQEKKKVLGKIKVEKKNEFIGISKEVYIVVHKYRIK